MKPESKRRLEVVEAAAQGVLSPLGFTKQKTNWRRTIGEVLQQFSIVSKQLGSKYRPEWGLNILGRCEDPKPLPWKLQVRWVFEISVANLEERLRLLDCLNFDNDHIHYELDMSDARRAELVVSLLQKHVIPRFDAFTTEDSVRRMMGDRKYPLRAQSYVRLPDEWWPGGRRVASSDAPPAPIIRPWQGE